MNEHFNNICDLLVDIQMELKQLKEEDASAYGDAVSLLSEGGIVLPDNGDSEATTILELDSLQLRGVAGYIYDIIHGELETIKINNVIIKIK